VSKTTKEMVVSFFNRRKRQVFEHSELETIGAFPLLRGRLRDHCPPSYKFRIGNVTYYGHPSALGAFRKELGI